MKRLAALRKSIEGLGYVGLFAFSLVFFVYWTFPYGVLKEAITTKLNSSMPYRIWIGELSPAFPLGVALEDLNIASPQSSARLKLAHLTVRINPFSILLGSVGVSVSARAGGGGYLDLTTSIPIWDAIFQGDPTPSRLELDAEKFSIDGILEFALGSIASSPGMSPLLAPLLQQISFRGKLDGQAKIKVDARNPADSVANINLALQGGALKIEDPSLNIAEQIFSKFLVKANAVGGKLQFDPSSGLKSDELQVDLSGNVVLKENIGASLLDVTIALKLDKQLKEGFGFIIDTALGGKDGEVKTVLNGSLAAPRPRSL